MKRWLFNLAAAMSLVLMPRGGPLEPKDIVEAIVVGAVVAGGAVLLEWLLAGRSYARLSATMDA